MASEIQPLITVYSVPKGRQGTMVVGQCGRRATHGEQGAEKSNNRKGSGHDAISKGQFPATSCLPPGPNHLQFQPLSVVYSIFQTISGLSHEGPRPHDAFLETLSQIHLNVFCCSPKNLSIKIDNLY